MVKAEAIEALLYGCSTWTLRQEHYAKLRTVHHRVLLRIIGAQRKRLHKMTSYNRDNPVREHCDNVAHENTFFVGWNERRVDVKANHVRTP